MKKQKYPSDLNDNEWEKIKQYLPAKKGTGRPIEIDRRDIVDGISEWLCMGAVTT